MARVDTLGNFLTDVADAIREKSGTSEPIQASEFDTAIEDIPSGSDLSEYFNYEPTTIATSVQWLKKNFAIGAPPIVIPNGTTNLQQFGQGYTMNGTTKIIMTDTSLTNISSLFNSGIITHFDGTEMNTTNVTTFNSIFAYCSSLLSVNVANWDVAKGTSFRWAFQSDYKLQELDLSNWELGKNASNIQIDSMFNGCSLLQKLDIRKFDFTKVSVYTSAFTSIPNGCEIIVADQTQKDWLTAKFTNLTNVKTVAEYEAE